MIPARDAGGTLHGRRRDDAVPFPAIFHASGLFFSQFL